MPKLTSASFVVSLLALLGCGGQQDAEKTSSPAVGGQTASTPLASGGALSPLTGATGGNLGSGGASESSASAAASGGTATSGGTSSGGASHTGGVLGSGGSRSSGGSSSGGTVTNPGTHTGGHAATGGSVASGGTVGAGGSKTTGGVTATGGTIAIGSSTVPVTGGATATGGSLAMGGGAPVWPKKFCGNTTTRNVIDPSGLVFAKHWDQITPENEGKWGSVQSSAASAFNWSRLDALYAYAEQNGVLFKEHTLVWGSAQPSGYTVAAVEAWIKAFCERYPKTALIDVVNEPPPHTIPPYANQLGEGEGGKYPWITKSFKLTRKYCGNGPVLILNDYSNIEFSDSETHFIEIVNDIKANGAPIDAVGAQAHDTARLTASQLQANIDKLSSETGLPIYITEFDSDKQADADQLAMFQDQFTIFWNTGSIRGVTLWGWISGATWKANTGIVNGTTPRPAMVWLMDTLGRPVPPP